MCNIDGDWEDVKNDGSEHYKTRGGIEPIDLYKSGGMLQDYCITAIIKYAFRNRSEARCAAEMEPKDLKKIIHCAEILLATRAEMVPVEYP